MPARPPTAGELTELRARVKALTTLQSATEGKECFTQTEHQRIDADLAALQSKLRTMEILFSEYTTRVETSRVKSAAHLSEREAILNNVFGEESMADQQELMSIFSSHHRHLHALVAEQTSGDVASNSNRDVDDDRAPSDSE